METVFIDASSFNLGTEELHEQVRYEIYSEAI